MHSTTDEFNNNHGVIEANHKTNGPRLPWLSAGPLPPRRTKKGSKKSQLDTKTLTEGHEAKVSNGISTPIIPSTTASPVAASPRSWSDLLKSPADRLANKKESQLKVGRTFTSMIDLVNGFTPEVNSQSGLILPRGLVNRGNMCYMNAILQVLLFCPPFYNLFRRIGSDVRQEIASKTPLLDAMVMFIREFETVDRSHTNGPQDFSAMLGEAELGDPFIPDHIYKSMKAYPQFNTMQRGQQEDAEEFLGFLLDGLHEELLRTRQAAQSGLADTKSTTSTNDDEWLEVGKKQKIAITRTANTSDSPISRIFGGQLRSILKIGNAKDSVTLEPFQPLQLDIQDPSIKTIVDALCAIPNTELIADDWVSNNGLKVRATKQVYIETLPPVLILHLKRFLYDNVGGVQKSWKQVGYPLELEIPAAAISPSNRDKMATKYRLTGVVYHHGLSAAGGHYTVDVIRQDRKTWLHFDDTSIERVPAERVAVEPDENGGSSSIRSNKLAYIILYTRI